MGLKFEYELYYKGHIYLVDEKMEVYMPVKLAGYISPNLNNSEENFRRVENSELVRTILMITEESPDEWRIPCQKLKSKSC